MVAYNFKAEFAERVEQRQKLTTIRALGKRRHAKPGDRIQLYTGQRTKGCRKLTKRDPICVFSLPVTIRDAAHLVQIVRAETLEMVYSPWEQDAIAQLDGFKHSGDLRSFFVGSFDQPMVLVRWTFVDVPRPVLPKLTACFDTWMTEDFAEFFPSNAMEERKFDSRWCNNCKHRTDSGCSIFDEHLESGDDVPLWVYIASCPCCLAFEGHG
jgi:hypothetical protein